jgi:predicted nucleic acid-binding Zn ribbon protein
MESLAGVLDRLLARLGLAEELKGWRAVEEWGPAVGTRVASHTRAVSFHDGVLCVEVDGSAWMHELGYLRHELVRTVNRALGADVIRTVKFVIPRKGVLR